jgi:hypothetical protein
MLLLRSSCRVSGVFDPYTIVLIVLPGARTRWTRPVEMWVGARGAQRKPDPADASTNASVRRSRARAAAERHESAPEPRAVIATWVRRGVPGPRSSDGRRGGQSTADGSPLTPSAANLERAAERVQPVGHPLQSRSVARGR